MSIEIQARSNTASIDNQLHADPINVGLKKTNDVVKVNQEPAQAVAPESPQKGAQATEVSKEKISEAVSKLQDYADQYKRHLQFSIDEDSGKTVVRLLDNDNKVLRQIPSEDVLSLAQRLKDHKGGFFEDQA